MKSENLETILIVDDSPANLSLIGQILKLAGLRILVAQDSQTTIEQATNKQPSLILLDIQMPNINGFEICKLLKENQLTQDIPIIFLTTSNNTEDIVKGLSLGAVDYISKSFQPEELLARLKTHLTIRQQQKTIKHQNQLLLQEIEHRHQIELALHNTNQQLELEVSQRTSKLEKALEQIQIQETELKRSLSKEKELSDLKSKIITTISHEYRTPLTIIFSSAELLEAYRHKWDDKKQLEHLERIKKMVNHMNNLVDGILCFNQMELSYLQFQPQSLDLNKYLAEIVQEMQAATNSHKLIYKAEGKCESFWGDAYLLRQTFNNLLSNAIKYSPKGGQIELKFTNYETKVIIEVVDNGIGIPSSEQDHLFDSFTRASNVGNIQGNGVGLTIVKKCVEMHQGNVSVKSKVNCGSVFTIELPKL
jgi:signal transduction histidine kinase